MFYAIAVALFCAWLWGFLFAHFGGSLIHVLLLWAIVIALYQLLRPNRTH